MGCDVLVFSTFVTARVSADCFFFFSRRTVSLFPDLEQGTSSAISC